MMSEQSINPNDINVLVGDITKYGHRYRGMNPKIIAGVLYDRYLQCSNNYPTSKLDTSITYYTPRRHPSSEEILKLCSRYESMFMDNRTNGKPYLGSLHYNIIEDIKVRNKRDLYKCIN